MINKILLSICTLGMSVICAAQNPFVQTCHTSDPAPLVVGDRLYVYTGHDEDNADFFHMYDWHVYSTADMVNWTDHGVPLSLATFSWADDRAWAAQTIERNGKYYWYVCAHSRLTNTMAVGVAVGDSPTGPFRDAIGKPLADGSWDFIDPTVFIDDDGQAYLYWGNPRLYYCKLNADMTSIDGEVQKVLMTEEGFGAPDPAKRVKDHKYKDMYTEGPWIMKRNKTYYMLYAAGGVPEHIAYSMSDNPVSGWKYMGDIMPLCDTGSFTNHCGVADFKGHSYFFYHTGKLPGGGGFDRSVAVEEFTYNVDGTFPIIMPTENGVRPVGTLNPYRRVEAETMAFSFGVNAECNANTGVYVSNIHNGDYIKLQAVDFKRNIPRTVTVGVASALDGGVIEIHTDSIHGKLLASINVPNTGGWEQWQTVTADVVALTEGIHDLYFTFHGYKGAKLMNFDWWQFRGIKECNMPLVQTKFTADPSPLIVGDTLFLYVSHDASPEDIPDANEKSSAGFFMYDWLLYSTTDMVNWTDHGAVASLRDFEWRSRENGAWAIQCVERNGKYYLYAPLHGHGIGVLVADSPYGPFKDPIGKPLVWDERHWDDIDPTVYIDDDGQAYMYWGNPHTYYILLNDDMISTKGERVKLDYHIDNYQEGPWLYKRDGKYYLAYASTCCPEAIGYAMSDSPTGPWKSYGYVMRPTERNRGNHPGIADYKGHSYVFGQNYDIMHITTQEHHERRSVSCTEITYNADGKINEVPYWLDQSPVSQLQRLNPYQRVEAETMAWGYGLKTSKIGIKNTGVVAEMPYSTGHVNMYVTDIDNDEYICVRGVDFGESGARKLIASVASASGQGEIDIRIDDIDGQQIGVIPVKATGGDERFRTLTAKVTPVGGVHDLYFYFSNVKGKINFDWWQFKR